MQETNHEQPSNDETMDVKETFSGIEMNVSLTPASELSDPQNIIFVCLPRTYDPGEAPSYLLQNKASQKLIESQVPFIPGIQPYNAWIHIFNPVKLSKGSGFLAYDKQSHAWQEQKPIELRDPNGFLIGFARAMGIEPSEPSREVVGSELLSLTDEELTDRLYARMISCLPTTFFGEELKNDAKLKSRVARLLVDLAKIATQPQDDSNTTTQSIYEELKEIFTQYGGESPLYRYGRVLLVSELTRSDNHPHRATFTLI